MLSVFDVPLSDAATRSGAPGAAATVSMRDAKPGRRHAGVALNVGLASPSGLWTPHRSAASW